MTFGLNITSRFFTKIIAYVDRILERKNVWCPPYLDDPTNNKDEGGGQTDSQKNANHTNILRMDNKHEKFKYISTTKACVARSRI